MYLSKLTRQIPTSFFLVALFAPGLGRSASVESFSIPERVVQFASNHYYTPANQILTPFGQQIELPGMRPQAIALSPDGKLLVTAGKTHELVVLNPATGKILQRAPLPSNE